MAIVRFAFVALVAAGALLVATGCGGSGDEGVQAEEAGSTPPALPGHFPQASFGDDVVVGPSVPIDDASSAIGADSEASTSSDAAPEGAVDASDPECDGGTVNACKGCSTLPHPVGDACGCGGKYACNGADAVTCSGASAPNKCGGCSTLANAPGGTCGTCGDGHWVCNGSDATSCSGASSRNVCGGCGGLNHTLGSNCPNACCATWQCSADGNDNWCDSTCSANACGGCSSLSNTMGASCDSCGGTWQCSGSDSLVCVDRCPAADFCSAGHCCDGVTCGAGCPC
jgi:hypothetical protein